MPWPLLALAASAGGSIADKIGERRAAKWQRNAMTNILNKLEEGNLYGRGIFGQMSQAMLPHLGYSTDAGRALLFGNPEVGDYGMLPHLDAARDAMSPERILSMYTNPQQWMSPEFKAALGQQMSIGDQLTGLAGGLGELGFIRALTSQIMSPEQAAGFASELANRQYLNQAEAARRQILARGGSPGSITASGIQNQGFADFADAAARAASDAGLRALLNQQDLTLRQQQLGGQMALGAGNLFQGAADVWANVPRFLLAGSRETLQSQMGGIDRLLNQADFYNRLFTQGWGPMTQMAGMGMNYAQTALGGMPGLLGGTSGLTRSNAPSWGQIGATIGQGIGGAINRPGSQQPQQQP